LEDHGLKRGAPTGAAMPLCWSHAEYICLVRSRHDGVCFDRIEPAFQRYVQNAVASRHEIWSLRHRLQRMPHGKILRVILKSEATVVWSCGDWANAHGIESSHEENLSLWFVDLPTQDLPANSAVVFTCFWKPEQRWQGENWQVNLL